MKKYIIISLFVSLFLFTKVQASTLPTRFSSTNVANVTQPTAMEVAPDGRIFVLEKGGSIRVIKNGSLLTTPFATISVDTNGERGLLGITFDPDFNSNHFLYVYYISSSLVPTVKKLTANGDIALDTGTNIISFDVMNNATNHNGGGLHFAPDGKLLLAIGENGNSANAQLLTNTKGKILRFNSDGTIPTDNPFYGSTTGNNRAIYAYGLRNPFTFSIDSNDGKIFVNDVGDATWEEINQLQAGGNYGWVNCEGFKNHGTNNDCTFPSVAPLYAYHHTTGTVTGKSIAGGVFYRGSTFPSEYQGKYFFGDYVNSWIKMYDPVSHTVSNFGTNFNGVVDLKVGQDGALYVANINTGNIERISYDTSVPVVAITAPTAGTKFNGLDTINYVGTGTDSEDGTLPAANFTWNITFFKGTQSQAFGDPITGTKSGSFQIPNTTASTPDIFYKIALTVTDGDGNATTTSTDITPNTVSLTLNSSPSGFDLLINGISVATPYDYVTAVNFEQKFEAPLLRSNNTQTYKFSSWSNSGGRIQTLNSPSSNNTYTANYTKVLEAGTWSNAAQPDFKFTTTKQADFNNQTYQSAVDVNGYLRTRITDGSTSGSNIVWSNWIMNGATTNNNVYLGVTSNRLYQSVISNNLVWTRSTDGTISSGQPVWNDWVMNGATTGDVVMKGLTNRLFQSVVANGLLYTRTTNDGTTWSDWVMNGGSTTGKVFMESSSNRLYQSVVSNDLVWTRSTDGTLNTGQPVWTNWVMSGGTQGEVYFGILNNQVYQSVVADGLVWTRETDGSLSSGNTVWNNWIMNGATTGKVLYGKSDGRLYQIVVANNFVWTRSTSGVVSSGNPVWNNWIMSGKTDKDVFMIDFNNYLRQIIITTNGEIWERSTDNSLDTDGNTQWSNWSYTGGGKGEVNLGVTNNTLVESVIATGDMWSRYIK